MAGICCGVVGEGETPAAIESSSRNSRRRRMNLLPLKLIADVAVQPAALENGRKRQKLDFCPPSSPLRECETAVENCVSSEEEGKESNPKNELLHSNGAVDSCESSKSVEARNEYPKFGVTSVCGRRRDMEDAVSVQPSFCHQKNGISNGFHFFGVFDGHGCSHVSAHILCLSLFLGEPFDSGSDEVQFAFFLSVSLGCYEVSGFVA